ncbi:protein Slg1p [Trichomonascus vanleenenianus]|uniref:protein Slg1p n=1 Tax=Trichomonascus vanleenenianus TaxID=2268995 RepID=UPI003EC9E6D4
MKLSLLAGAFMGLLVSAQYNPAGCYGSVGSLQSAGANTWNTGSKCYSICSAKGMKVFATQGQDCYCGDSLPSSSDKASSGSCSQTCPGYPQEMCGGPKAFTVYVVGDLSDFTSSSASSAASSTPSSTSSSSSSSSASSSLKPSSSSSSSSATSPSSSSTSSSSTSSSASSSSSRSTSANSATASGPTATGGSDNKKASGVSGGAIAGIVIGVLAALGIIGATLVFLRRRQNNNHYNPSSDDDGFKDPFGVHPSDTARDDKHSYGGSIAASTRTPSNDDNFMAIDQRLNPVMLGERRISDGSLADENDYSRKILRVTNPDN